MANIMKYVVNNLNQLPTYCYAEENKMPDNCCKATLTEDNVSSVTPGPTHYTSHQQQQQPMRPPPGFSFLDEQRILSNSSSTSFNNDYPFMNILNTPIFGDTKISTNPFLSDQQFSFNNIKQMYTSILNENKNLKIKIIDVLCNLERSLPSLMDQIRLTNILNIILALLEQKNLSIPVKTSSNTASETPSNDNSAQKMPYNLNNKSFVKQDFNVNGSSMSNPFNDERPHTNTTCNSDSGFNFTMNQCDEFSPHTQVSSSTTDPTASIFVNHISSANDFHLNTNQENPTTSMSPTNTDNFSTLLDNVNNQFANTLKNTNPFKFHTIDGMQNEKQQISYNYDMSTASYLPTRDSQQGVPKTETMNIYAQKNCFTPAKHANKNYTTKIVYESGPVMYNTAQKKQVDTDTKRDTYSINIDNIQNLNLKSSKLRQDEISISQPANNITQHKVIDRQVMNSQVEQNYTTRPSTYYTPGSQPVTGNQSTYWQNYDANSWNQVLENLTNSKYQNENCVPNYNENTTFNAATSTPVTNSIHQEMNEAINSNYFSNMFKDNRKEIVTDSHWTCWNNESKSVQKKDEFNNSFVLKKIDLVKGITFLFNIDQDGWILAYEFVETFTNLKLYSSLLNTLKKMNIQVIFKEIKRSEYPLQFLQLDRFPLNVPRDSEKRIISLNLISLQSALTLLHKLKIISREEIDNAFKKNEFLNGSILSKLWILIVTYRELKQRIELCTNYI